MTCTYCYIYLFIDMYTLLYLFIFGCIGLYLFVAVHGLSQVAESRGYSLDAMWRLLIAVASLGEHRL